PAGLGERLAEGAPVSAPRNLQYLQLLEEAARGKTGVGDGRGPAGFGGVAADVVSASEDQRRHLLRLSLHHRRQPRGGGQARRRRNLGNLDREPKGRVPRRLRQRV